MKKIIVVFLTVILLSCQQGGGPLSPTDRDAIQGQVKALEQAFKDESAEGLKAVYSADVISMPPNANANAGPDKVVEFHTAEGGPTLVSFSLNSEEIEGNGDVAYSRGTWTYKGKVNDSTEVNDNGKYLVIFRKQADNSWRLSRETWNSNLPLPGM